MKRLFLIALVALAASVVVAPSASAAPSSAPDPSARQHCSELRLGHSFAYAEISLYFKRRGLDWLNYRCIVLSTHDVMLRYRLRCTRTISLPGAPICTRGRLIYGLSDSVWTGKRWKEYPLHYSYFPFGAG